MLVSCAQCGAEFAPYRVTNRYCSRRCCWNAASARGRDGRSSTRPCEKCGAPVGWTPGRAVCASCHVDPRTASRRNDRARTLRAYGLSSQEYDDMVIAQGGKCAICGTGDPRGGSRKFQHYWSIDHDHRCCPGFGSCGKCVRGLLCSPCNLAIGQFGDNPDTLRAALNYLTAKSVV